VSSKNEQGFVEMDAMNWCGLTLFGKMSCLMGKHQAPIDWESCYVTSEVKKAAVEMNAAKFNFFPQEFWPEGGDSWKGISYEAWKNWVMGEEVERPDNGGGKK